MCIRDSLKLIALLIFTLSASYTSAQSLRKLLERPYGIIESKWEKDAQGATELNYYNEDYCDYYLYRANDLSLIHICFNFLNNKVITPAQINISARSAIRVGN